MKIFDKNLALYEKAMDFRVQRQQLISSNLANRETPAYLAKDIVFENALNDAYHSNRPGDLRTSDNRHLTGQSVVDVSSVKGAIINSHNPDPRKDGNTVDLDKENQKLAENSIMFNALTRMASHNLGLLKAAVSENGG